MKHDREYMLPNGLKVIVGSGGSLSLKFPHEEGTRVIAQTRADTDALLAVVGVELAAIDRKRDAR